ncbi:MAG: Peptidase prolyl oligopeptidase active site domain protein [Candidatus Angelobacter sp.]|nr:Peptidase prolyl oligopeptidase active site domain protein [Candidatus Angelobacter sp.]
MVLTLTTLAACKRMHYSSPEVLLFAEIGSSPFSDTLSIVETNGSHEYVLSAGRARSYLFVSARSIRGDAVVNIHELNRDRQVQDHLYIGTIGKEDWKRLVQLDGIEAESAISSDGHSVVFSFAPSARPAQYELWVMDLVKGEARQLTKPSSSGRDTSPVWSPDGQKIMFIRVERASLGYSARIMQVDSMSGAISQLVDTDEVIIAGNYLHQGAEIVFVSAKGIETITLADHIRRRIFSWDRVPPGAYIGGGVAVSRTRDIVVLPLFDSQQKRFELRSFNLDGTGGQILYSTNKRISGLSFVSTN